MKILITSALFVGHMVILLAYGNIPYWVFAGYCIVYLFLHMVVDGCIIGDSLSKETKDRINLYVQYNVGVALFICIVISPLGLYLGWLEMHIKDLPIMFSWDGDAPSLDHLK